MEIFSEELKKRREFCGFSREDVENLLCLKKGTMKKWESGKAEPNLNTLQILAAFFLCTADELLGNRKQYKTERR